MTTVYLYGHLGRKFGWRWSLDVKTPAEAVRALIANRPDFHLHLTKHSSPGYRVYVGPDTVDEKGLQNPVGRQAIRIVPVIAGAAKPGWVNIVVGVVLIAAAFYLGPYGIGFLSGGVALLVGGVGATLAISGITQMLAGTPESIEANERPENKPSFLFNGPVNTIAQGHPVPVGYGRLRVGSAVISGAITTVG